MVFPESAFFSMHHAGTLRANAAAMERSTKLRGRCHGTRILFYWCPAILLVASFLGCVGAAGSGPAQLPPSSPSGVAVTVVPSTASVLLGDSQSFTATVANTTNTAVSWSVNGISGGNATVGTIDVSGVYTAPANLPTPVAVSVQATSAADSSKSSAALVTISSGISVSISPQTMQVELGASRPFTATVNSAGHPNRSVTWIVSGGACPGTSCGTVDSSGMYTAPQVLIAPTSVSLTAISAADPSKSGTGTITVTSLFSLAVAGPSSVFAGSTAAYTATLTPAANSNPSRVISWSVAGSGCTGAGCGTISSSGVYTAPSVAPSPATVQIIATPQADPSKATSVSVSIIPLIAVSISPSAAAVPLGATRAFQATVTGAANTAVTWDVNGVVGGNPTVGTILNSAATPDSTTYTAPLTMPAGGSVTVHASSNANPRASASATITFNTSVNLALTPASAALAVGQRQTFTVQVNNTPNQNVTWLANEIPGGNSLTGQICVTGSNPCRPLSTSNGGTIDYVAPAGLPSLNPVILTAASQTAANVNAFAIVTILAHVTVRVQPGSAAIGLGGKLQFAASVAGNANSQVTWSITGAGCGTPGVCGTIDASGLYTAPATAPSPAVLNIVATSSADPSQSGAATVTLIGGPDLSSLAPASAYAGSAGGFTLLASGTNFFPSDPGPASTLVVAGTPRTTFCTSSTQCTTSLAAADLQSAGNLQVQLQSPAGNLSNPLTFVVLAPGSGTGTIPLTPSAPASAGNNIVVVELSTNGGSGASGNVSLNIAAIGAYSVATSSCLLAGNPVIIQRPATGTTTADLCVFSVSGLDPSFTYTIGGPPAPDVTIINREPLGLGILHLTLQVPATAAPGPRTLFVENPEGDQAAGTGAIEVR
jgi:hypothetical protein